MDSKNGEAAARRHDVRGWLQLATKEAIRHDPRIGGQGQFLSTRGGYVSDARSGFRFSSVVSGCNIPVFLSLYSLFLSRSLFPSLFIMVCVDVGTVRKGKPILCSLFRVIIITISSKDVEFQAATVIQELLAS